MQAKITKWGNSLGVRIPKLMAQEINLFDGEPVELTLKNNCIVIHKGYRLESLVAEITDENKHGEFNTDSPVGKEIW